MSKNNITEGLWIHIFVKKCQHQTPRQELKKINVWFVRLTLCCDSVGISQKQRVHSQLFAWHLTLCLLALHLSQPSGIHKSYAADRSPLVKIVQCSITLLLGRAKFNWVFNMWTQYEVDADQKHWTNHADACQPEIFPLPNMMLCLGRFRATCHKTVYRFINESLFAQLD